MITNRTSLVLELSNYENVNEYNELYELFLKLDRSNLVKENANMLVEFFNFKKHVFKKVNNTDHMVINVLQELAFYSNIDNIYFHYLKPSIKGRIFDRLLDKYMIISMPKYYKRYINYGDNTKNYLKSIISFYFKNEKGSIDIPPLINIYTLVSFIIREFDTEECYVILYNLYFNNVKRADNIEKYFLDAVKDTEYKICTSRIKYNLRKYRKGIR